MARWLDRRAMDELQPHLEFTRAQAERILEAWLGAPAACRGMQRLEGGLVNTVLRLDLDRPPFRAVVKLHRSTGDTFAAEARALEFLRTRTACPVPRVYLEDGSARLIPYAFLLIEHLPGRCLDGLELEPAERADLEVQLAEILGALHAHKGDRWGGFVDTDRAATWADLFMTRLMSARAHPKVELRLEPRVLALVDDAIRAAPAWLADAGTPSLIHGDVWDGNLLVRRDRDRWQLSGLLDPALQFADVEYELAYLEVFDGRRDAFFAAYPQEQARRPGYQLRRLVYWLHTALIHVALFDDPFFGAFTARTAASLGRPEAA